MAKYGSSSFSVLLVGGYSLLGAKVKNVTAQTENLTEDTTGLGDSWIENTPTGMAKGMFSQDGAFFDDATNSIHDAFKAMGKTLRVGCIGYAGNTIGKAFTGFKGLVSAAYEVLGKVGELTKANATYAVSGEVEIGKILHAHAAETADWTGSSVDDAAGSAAGGAGYIQVSGFSGFTSVDVKIQHSPDDSTWADLITFTSVTSAPTAERIAVAGSVDRYVRSVGDVTGTGSATVFVGFARN